MTYTTYNNETNTTPFLERANSAIVNVILKLLNSYILYHFNNATTDVKIMVNITQRQNFKKERKTGFLLCSFLSMALL